MAASLKKMFNSFYFQNRWSILSAHLQMMTSWRRASDTLESRPIMQQDLHRLEKWTERSIWKFNQGKRKVCTWGGITPCRISKGEWVDCLESSLGEEAGGNRGTGDNKDDPKTKQRSAAVLEDKLHVSQQCVPAVKKASYVLSIPARV